jgi:hypothetical protein
VDARLREGFAEVTELGAAGRFVLRRLDLVVPAASRLVCQVT